MSLPDLEDIPGLSDKELLSLVNDCQNAFEDGEDPVRAFVTSSAAHRELRRRGMTEIAIESYKRNLPNWRGGH